MLGLQFYAHAHMHWKHAVTLLSSAEDLLRIKLLLT
jgi:hypothetical protein